MGAKSFTLLELLIVLAIMSLLAGIVLPLGLSRLAADRFTQAQQQLGSAVGIARADAQRRGVILQLTAQRDASGVFVIWSEELSATEEAPDPRSSKEPALRREYVLELPSGVRVEVVVGGASDDEDASAADESADDERSSSPANESAAAEPIRLCVLMPDGTVVAGDAVLLAAGDRAVRINLNMWTGEAEFARYELEDESGDVPTDRPEPEVAP